MKKLQKKKRSMERLFLVSAVLAALSICVIVTMIMSAVTGIVNGYVIRQHGFEYLTAFFFGVVFGYLSFYAISRYATITREIASRKRAQKNAGDYDIQSDIKIVSDEAEKRRFEAAENVFLNK